MRSRKIEFFTSKVLKIPNPPRPNIDRGWVIAHNHQVEKLLTSHKHDSTQDIDNLFGWLLKRPAFSKISQPGYTLQWCHRRPQRKRPPTRWGRWSHAWNLPPFQLPNNKLVPGPMLLTPFPCKFWKFLYLLEWFVYIFLFTLENFMGELVLPQIQGNVLTEASTSHKICNFIGLWKTGQ